MLNFGVKFQNLIVTLLHEFRSVLLALYALLQELLRLCHMFWLTVTIKSVWQMPGKNGQ